MKKITACLFTGIFMLLISCAVGFSAGDETATSTGTAGTEAVVAAGTGNPSPTVLDKALLETMKKGEKVPDAAVPTAGVVAGGTRNPSPTVLDKALLETMKKGEKVPDAAVPTAGVVAAAGTRVAAGALYVTLSNPGKEVFVKNSSGEWTPAADGMVILPGDEVRTEEGSTVTVILDGGKVGNIEVKGGSLFTVLEAKIDPMTGDKKTLVDLAVGKIMVKAQALTGNSKFEVKTSSSITGVRGTLFEVMVEGKLPPMTA